MDRKKFLKNLTLSFLAISSFSYADYLNTYRRADKIIKPAKLKKGDRLGLIAPGEFITEEELITSIDNLEALGFKISYTKNILSRNGYLAGTDEQRASDLNEMFSRNDIDGIVAARGGYGCTRILPLIDYNLIEKNPKVLLGYSDITALHMAIYSKTGLVSFHGPVGISTFNEYTVSNLKNILLYSLENLTLYNAEDDEHNNSNSFTIISGKSSGRLIGGNLSLMVSLIGTPYDFDPSGKLIFIEEIGEQPYRIDRMLTQMIEAGKFEKASGIILGEFVDCEPDKNDLNSFSLKEVLYNCLFNLNVPVIYGMSFGHIKNKLTLPIGINAELNSISQTITLLESAVQ